MERDVFVNYCPIPGLWGHRIYNCIKNCNKTEEAFINFTSFIQGLRKLCRSEDDELDETIFEMFNLSENKTFITR